MHLDTLAMMLTFAAIVTSTAGFAMPTSGARAGVIDKLFPGLPAQIATLFPVPFSSKRRAVLRWRVSESRADVDRITREVDALMGREGTGSPAAAAARSARIAELRKYAGIAEGKILRLKAKLGTDGATRPGLLGSILRASETLVATEEQSARVVFNILQAQRDPWELLRQDTGSLLRLGTNSSLVTGYLSLRESPRLLPHAVAIATRAAKLERHAPGILLALDTHLELIEPHLDEILDRFDDIEPHLPFILEHLDELAPYCGVLIDHLDTLLLYADEQDKLPVLIKYVPDFAPQLDALTAHVGLIRPHLDRIMPHLPVLAPTAYRFSPYCAVSANADVILWWFGWVLRLPFARWLLRLPLVPRVANFAARHLPRRPVRGRTADYVCEWEACAVEVASSFEQKRKGLRPRPSRRPATA